MVVEGVYWIRMPLPFALDHINLWLLKDGDGWAVVDTGINRIEVRNAWKKIFKNFFCGLPVTRVIVTHFHPDHAGLAGWLCKTYGVKLLMPASEWMLGRMLSHDVDPSTRRETAKFYRLAGFQKKIILVAQKRLENYKKWVFPLPASINKIEDCGSIIVDGCNWEIIIGKGHSPEHACLYCKEKGVFISGDQVLPKISPNISVWHQQPDANPLAEYLVTLEIIKRKVSNDTLSLPSHNSPFLGFHERIDDLRAHHHERLIKVMEICQTPATAVNVMEKLFDRRLDTHQIFFAVGETLAHLNLLWKKSHITRELGKRGVFLFSSRDR